MEQVKSIIKGIISNLEEKEEKEENIIKLWEDAAGVEIAKHTKPISFRRKKLLVNVDNSSWLYKLTLEKNTLIDKFNLKVSKKQKKIKELQFRIGKI